MLQRLFSPAKASTSAPGLFRKDKRVVKNQRFQTRAGYETPLARFGDWMGFYDYAGMAISFHNPFTDETRVLELGKEAYYLYCVNLGDGETLDQVVTMDSTQVGIWRELKLEKRIPLADCGGVTKQPVKLDSTHILGIKTTYNTGNYSLVYIVNIVTGAVLQKLFQYGQNVVALPSPADKKENHFAVTTLDPIHVYKFVSNLVEERFDRVQTIECAQGGEIWPSPNGEYWITRGRVLDFEGPKLWKVSADYQLTLVVTEGLNNPTGWFAGHIFYPFHDQLYATHPETLATYCLFGDTANYRLLDNQLMKCKRTADKVEINFFMDQNLFEDQDLVRTVAKITGMPLTVTRVACDYLFYSTRNTQVFFPPCKTIFEPVIPEKLPQNLHQQEREKQWREHVSKISRR